MTVDNPIISIEALKVFRITGSWNIQSAIPVRLCCQTFIENLWILYQINNIVSCVMIMVLVDFTGIKELLLFQPFLEEGFHRVGIPFVNAKGLHHLPLLIQ